MRVGEPAEPPSCQGSGLVILPVNEEFPVSASHQLALIKSLLQIGSFSEALGLWPGTARLRPAGPSRGGGKKAKLDFL